MNILVLNPPYVDDFCRSARWAAKSRGRVQRHPDWEKEGMMSHQNLEAPVLTDVPMEDFRKVFGEGRRLLRGMRYRLVVRFFLNAPLAVMGLFIKNVPHYLKRSYYLIFRF